jgi:hypothetical protein
MALPILSKTWIFKTNRVIRRLDADLPNGNPTFLFLLKDSLANASGWTNAAGSPVTNSYPWTVTSSSDSVSAGLSDYWLDEGDVIVNSTNFSWVVLRQPQINPLYEIAFGIGSGLATYQHNFYVAPTLGFSQTGLVPTAYPASLGDRYQTTTNNSINGSNTTNFELALHIMMSTDGQCTYVFGCRNNAVVMTWLILKPKNPVTGWANPAITVQNRGTSPTYNSGISGVGWFAGHVPPGIFTVDLGYSCYSPAGGLGAIGYRQQTVNQLTGEWPIIRSHFTSFSTSMYFAGSVGEPFDIWLAPANRIGTSPDVARSFAVFGDLLVPWDGTIPLIS